MSAENSVAPVCRDPAPSRSRARACTGSGSGPCASPARGSGARPRPDEAIAVLRRAVELGVDFIDTADSYGPDVSEELIAEALHPYGEVVIATKAGLVRTGPGRWRRSGGPSTCARSSR